jgi:hypothetical protein
MTTTTTTKKKQPGASIAETAMAGGCMQKEKLPIDAPACRCFLFCRRMQSHAGDAYPGVQGPLVLEHVLILLRVHVVVWKQHLEAVHVDPEWHIIVFGSRASGKLHYMDKKSNWRCDWNAQIARPFGVRLSFGVRLYLILAVRCYLK